MTAFSGNGYNHQDPLNQRHPSAVELLRQVSGALNGVPADIVEDVAINLLVNALRQAYPMRGRAEARYDELVGGAKSVLLSHYDGVTGKRRSTFPHAQGISAPHFVNPNRMS